MPFSPILLNLFTLISPLDLFLQLPLFQKCVLWSVVQGSLLWNKVTMRSINEK